jgi:hypothetical protein
VQGYSSADAGDEAFVTSVGGGVRIDNDVFVFQWGPKNDADDAISQLRVLKSVVATLRSS